MGAEAKLQVKTEAAELSDEDLGEFLRRKVLHEAQIEEWRWQAIEALAPRRRRAKVPPEAERVRELEKELRRKDKALPRRQLLSCSRKGLERSGGTRTTTRTGHRTSRTRRASCPKTVAASRSRSRVFRTERGRSLAPKHRPWAKPPYRYAAGGPRRCWT